MGRVPHLHGLVAVGGEVLGGDADDEAAPEAARDAEEHVPVLDHAVGVLKDAGELWRQRIVAHCEHRLPARHSLAISMPARPNVGMRKPARHRLGISNQGQPWHAQGSLA